MKAGFGSAADHGLEDSRGERDGAAGGRVIVRRIGRYTAGAVSVRDGFAEQKNGGEPWRRACVGEGEKRN